eukprot:1254091-Prymnesium_polylepis.1
MRDWTSHFRSPYWNHEYIHDWSAAASNFTLRAAGLMSIGAVRREQPVLAATGALFLPVQWLFNDVSYACCIPVDKFCKDRAACQTPTATSIAAVPPVGCCNRRKGRKLLNPEMLRTRTQVSVPRGGRGNSASRCAMGDRSVLRRSLSVASAREIALTETRQASEIWREEAKRAGPVSADEKGTACTGGLVARPTAGDERPWLLRIQQPTSARL